MKQSLVNALALTALFGALHAQDVVPDARKPRKEADQEPAATWLRASDLLGAKVKSGVDKEAKTIGSVDDVIVSGATGRLLFGVVSTGGFLGVGDTLTAVPCELLVWKRPTDSDKDVLVLDTTKTKLASAPKFDLSKVEHYLGDETWRKESAAAFGSIPKLDPVARAVEASTKGEVRESRPYRLLGNLKGAALQGLDEKIGKIDEVVIDKSAHSVAFLVAEDRAIPFAAVTLRDDDLHVAQTKEAFQKAPKLDKDVVARLSNAEYVSRVKAFFAPSKDVNKR